MPSHFSLRPICHGLVSLLFCLQLASPVQASQVSQPLVPTDNQTLIRGSGAKPDSLDPARIHSGLAGEAVLVDLFEGLVREDGQGRIVPGQAQRWERSADGLSWRFFLRPGLKWSNGEPLVAQDFVYAWRRLLDPAQLSPSVGLLLATGIDNAQAIYGGALALDALGVEAQGDQILKVTLERPVPYLLSLLSQSPFVPVSEKAVRAFGKQWTQPGKLISNGAYQLVSWAPDGRIEAERNGHYWDAPHTRIQRVIYQPIAARHEERLRYEAGEIQLTNRVAPGYYQKLRQTAPERLWEQPLLGTYLYVFNLRLPALQDVRVRQALALALDRQQLTESIGGQGEAPARSLLPAMPGYEALSPDLAAQDRQARLAKAGELLAQAGYDSVHPLKLNLIYNRSEHHRRLAQAVAAMWQPLGVVVTPGSLEWSAYQVAKDGGDFMLARSSLFGDYVEPSAMLNAFRCQDPQNESGYCNPAFDALLQQASDALDDAARSGLYHQAERLLMDEVPVIPVYHYNQVRLVDPALRGLPSGNLRGIIATRELYFDEQGRSER